MSDISTGVLQRELGDRYAIERELGRGGMGVVFLARDLRLERPVALKVLPEEFVADLALRERFLRETRTAASFSHPNIVPVYAVEEREHVVAYAMGYIEGESVAQRVQRSGPLAVREIVRMLQDIGYALAYAHGRGVVHRDIKPDNIMLERATGRAMLMDFGISRVMESASSARGLTRVGEVVGTPEYMSPEQAAGDVVDGRSDIYSLGLVAWFAVTGRTAMTGESTQKILVKQLTEAVLPVESIRPELPDLLSAAIDACVAKVPEDRFATAEALVEAVDNSQLAGPEIPLPVRIFTQELGTMSLVVVFVSLIGWYIFRSLSARVASLDALLPVVILFSVALTRVLQALSEAHRLFEAGYTRESIMTGMHHAVDEREGLRAALRTDVPTLRRRRKTLWVAAAQLPIALALVWVALQMREVIAPGQFRMPTGGVAMVLSAMMMIGVSVVLFARSPVRMPIGERFFRRIWLGPIGRAFLALASRGVDHAANLAAGSVHAFARLTPSPVTGVRTGVTRTPTRNSGGNVGTAPVAARLPAPEIEPSLHGTPNGAAPSDGERTNEAPPVASPLADAAEGPLARLERRIDALEAWRDEQRESPRR
ncbi:MAG: protein kinase [Gemmatimonadota bacterium]